MLKHTRGDDPWREVEQPLRRRVLTALLLLLPLAAFWQCVRLPFVMDDWVLLQSMQKSDAPALLARWFDPSGAMFYRPLGKSWLLVAYTMFGLRPWPFHVVALAIHTVNALLVSRIMTSLARDRSIGLMVGMLYGVGVSIHLDALCWAVGIYDLGGALFFFLAVWLFLRRRPGLSAASFLAGVLFKDSVMTLPLVLAGLTWLRHPAATGKRGYVRDLLPSFVVLGGVVAMRCWYCISPLSMPPSNPYVVQLGPHLATNAAAYVGWMLQAILPFDGVLSWRSWAFFGLAMAAAAVAVRMVARRSGLAAPAAAPPIDVVATLSFLGFWVVATLSPALLLPNHRYRYYATCALPAFLCALLLLASAASSRLGCSPLLGRRLLGAGTALAVCLCAIQATRIFQQGAQQSILVDGTCALVRKGATVRVVQAALLRQLPRPRDHALLALGAVDLSAFAGDFGLQAWYRNRTLHVCRLESIRHVSGRPYRELSRDDAPSSLQPVDDLHAFRLVDGDLVPLTATEAARAGR